MNQKTGNGVISNFFGDFWFHDGPGFAELLDEPGLFKNRASTIAPPKTRLDNRVIGVAELGCVVDICDYPASHCDCVDAFLFSLLGGLCLFIGVWLVKTHLRWYAAHPSAQQ